ncbi:MAG: pyridoxal phosphate-dependent aminotransferase [Castellaniella sp.]|uniref:pyridoxal phosphate-dependent aminotransferase n=1 Tax=Castellaniella sp. TaxID=1955812 RepID=UPI002A359251|nr:pyridoxal phosphate-dependent aminotransferase [Castellaniella sp.]MDY0308874.1 pyridoxal phosphate-dependent aminotransferase [Castellaniella sp.]
MVRLADRTERTVPFYAVEVLKQAQALAAQGHDIISLGIGEPDFTAPARVLETLNRAADAGLSGYTAPAGIPALREAIAHYYGTHFGATVDPACVLITSGASGALLLAAMALVDPGDEVLMPDPSYPANRNFITAAGGITRLVPTTAEHRYQLRPEDIDAHWGPATRGVLIASPSNPTGTSMPREALRALVDAVRARGGFVILDEIYLGLTYDAPPQSGLTLDDGLVVINSFSKYFHMTGWRLGWLIAPKSMMPALERLAASLAICAPALAQHAALSCFEPEVMQVYERRRLSFKERRDFLLPAFERLGLHVPAAPDGAFYIFSDIHGLGMDSTEFCHRLLHEAGVAAVPGLDFGQAHAQRTVRFSYATSLDRLREAVARMAVFLGQR